MAAALVLAACHAATTFDAPVVRSTGTPIARSTGTPIAAATPESAPSSAGDLYRRTRDDLIAVERAHGAPAALAELGTRIEDEPGLAGVCHAIAHDLGHEAIAEVGGNAAKALKSRDDVCGGGFTHGVIEVALGASKHPERDLLTICAPVQDGSCFHGVGHGLMFATGMDVDRSLALCDHAPSAQLASRCGEGVFMQLFSADVAGGHAAHGGSAPITADTARSTCEGARQPYAANCWFYAPTVLLAEHPEGFGAAMQWCRGAPAGPGRTLCARGVGSRTIKYHPEDPTIGARVCARAGALTDSCLAGMGSYWSVHFRGERAASDVCRHLGNAELARRCRAVT